MKPKLFIVSSREARALADAIHTNLMHDAECTVWASGAFGLSDDQRESFNQQLSVSDFAAFVFAADDQITIRGQALMSARDNVIYEAGLFSGRLEFGRCFIAIPSEGDFRVPTDLADMTLGKYEPNRDNPEAAVNSFCAQLRRKIASLGFLARPIPDTLVALIAQYDESDAIEPMSDRVRVKDDIFFNQMVQTLRTTEVSKSALLAQQTPGSVAALAAAVSIHSAHATYLIALKLPRSAAHEPAPLMDSHNLSRRMTDKPRDLTATASSSGSDGVHGLLHAGVDQRRLNAEKAQDAPSPKLRAARPAGTLRTPIDAWTSRSPPRCAVDRDLPMDPHLAVDFFASHDLDHDSRLRPFLRSCQPVPLAATNSELEIVGGVTERGGRKAAEGVRGPLGRDEDVRPSRFSQKPERRSPRGRRSRGARGSLRPRRRVPVAPVRLGPLRELVHQILRALPPMLARRAGERQRDRLGIVDAIANLAARSLPGCPRIVLVRVDKYSRWSTSSTSTPRSVATVTSLVRWTSSRSRWS
jgi:hypothetical protein